MFKSLDSIASVVGMFMYLTISKLKQVLRSRKGLGKVSTTTLSHSHKISYTSGYNSQVHAGLSGLCTHD